jgi:hypothetical protein
MKITLEINLQPFTVPDFVLAEESPKERQEGFSEGRKYELHELSAETLEALCWKFKQEVFAKAGKNMLPTAGEPFFPARRRTLFSGTPENPFFRQRSCPSEGE